MPTPDPARLDPSGTGPARRALVAEARRRLRAVLAAVPSLAAYPPLPADPASRLRDLTARAEALFATAFRPDRYSAFALSAYRSGAARAYNEVTGGSPAGGGAAEFLRIGGLGDGMGPGVGVRGVVLRGGRVRVRPTGLGGNEGRVVPGAAADLAGSVPRGAKPGRGLHGDRDGATPPAAGRVVGDRPAPTTERHTNGTGVKGDDDGLVGGRGALPWALGVPVADRVGPVGDERAPVPVVPRGEGPEAAGGGRGEVRPPGPGRPAGGAATRPGGPAGVPETGRRGVDGPGRRPPGGGPKGGLGGLPPGPGPLPVPGRPGPRGPGREGPVANAARGVPLPRDPGGRFLSDRAALLAARLEAELKNCGAAGAAAMARVFDRGIREGWTPARVARGLREAVYVSEAKALTVARTELVRINAEAALDAAELLGAVAPALRPEWRTSAAACPRCAAASRRRYTPATARGVIPVHPRCLCSWRFR